MKRDDEANTGDGSEVAAEPISRAERKVATRGRVLDAAAEMFAEREYSAVTVSEIAHRAGVAHGLVFHHFGSKQGLYRAVLDRFVGNMDAAFAAGATDNPGDAIRAGLRAHLCYVADHPALAQRLISGGRSPDSDVCEASQAGRDRALEMLARLTGVDSRNDTVQLVGRTIIAAADEASLNWVRTGCRTPVDHLVTWLVEMGSAAVRTAAVLDPDVDVDAALEAVRTGGWPETPAASG
ncbi:TetR/AcrR family transcriptional regulator [Dietzia sp. PP-33]|uniref:TetR/AcrR family transcriptional regulator n=1 Tax=Dietzia sp. PP-33 TaxID=2957500 RepID=UPI0029A2532A|nr:TetR/AcrR family transcriptional regulator [Dietzia sp. PP-33]MDX2356517.1 TetR/AcrR family transcriptional regulator [Dietzia sp. PP-33]